MTTYFDRQRRIVYSNASDVSDTFAILDFAIDAVVRIVKAKSISLPPRFSPEWTRLFRERRRRFDDADAMPHEIDEAADDGGFDRPLHGRDVPADRTESDLVE